jgi:hypothetical protein
MKITVRGVIRGKIIELKQPPGVPDGQPVGVTIEPLADTGAGPPPPERKARVPGNRKGMITLAVEDEEHLKDFEE